MSPNMPPTKPSSASLTSSTLFAAVIGAVVLATGAAQAATPLDGVWIDDKGRGGVEIKECGGNLCGHVVWLKDTSDAKGCGKQIIGDVKPVGDGKWDNGWIWDPAKGRNFDVELSSAGPDKLRVKGYMGAKFLSRTMIWTRAPADIVRCSAAGSVAAAPPDGTTATDATDALPPAGAAKLPKAGRPATDEAQDGKVDEKVAKVPENELAPPAPADKEPGSDSDKEVAATDEGGDINLEDGFEIGGYGIKVKPGGGSQKTCVLDVPYFKAEFPCPKK